MTKYKFAPVLGVVLALPAASVLAQTPASGTPQAQRPVAQTPPQKTEKDDQPAAVGDVVVSARANDVRTSIDSISYSLADDLQAATGTLAEALRNVPSVDVDPQGNVSLRGDGNVTILVDGRPSAILSGPNRADAVLQLPADRYARIEVMTNPSAAYSPEGSGGVINLITKPVPAAVAAAAAAGTPGAAVTTGSLRANVGDHGRWNVGASGSRQQGKLTLTGDLSYRHDEQSLSFGRLREQLNAAGATTGATTTVQDIESTQDGFFGRVAAEYRLTEKTMLTGEARANRFDIDSDLHGLFETRDASGALTRAYTRDGAGGFAMKGWGLTGRVLHQFDASGHEWSNELRYDRNDQENDSLGANVFRIPTEPTVYEAQRGLNAQEMIGFTSAYTRPMGEGAKLRAGYELNLTRPDQDNAVRRGPSENALAPVPSLSNQFEAEQTVHALYATYERPFGEKLSGQFGLRLEQADIEVEDVTNAVRASQDYFRAYPTFHLQYQLTETQTLRGSYSRRIQRPQPSQLNPFVVYGDPLNLRSGNPDLEPQETDSFEAMWQMRRGQSFYQATAYFRDTNKAFTDVATDVGGGVLLTRPENLGARRDLGIELTASGRLHPTLRYNASVNAFRQEIDAAGIPGGRDREGEMVSGRLSLNWQATPKDFVQLMGFWQGDQLLAQGKRESGGMLNFGYRRKLNDTLSLQFTARDLLNSFGGATTYDTPQFRERLDQDLNLRAFYLGLSWSFGGPRRQPEQFDFSTGPSGG
ncbi:TonB-dependent receptor domain-containing protein [Brevundimonas guildfordensis]|uniref:TonB-dependent receptor n=1 Tax=Brevundimonas guildfordensis TaxID=2762241 RepID=A0ABR8R3Q5_9CAUL|nr:TonB-dependent receptor [Brevundimonas guildfordensis]MBD7942435.1 TonB-dependent receptor [Brevundimonas guildfordensis]